MTWRMRWRGPAWLVVLGAVTVALLPFRADLDKAHVTLAFLLVVLLGTMSGGRRVGLVLAGAAFLLFNWFFLQPYGTLRVTNPLDWSVLVVFVIVSAAAAEMLHRLQREAASARANTDEIRRLAEERIRLVEAADRADALHAADRLKDALLASVSHDLRTPLTTIKALAHDLAPSDDRAMVIEEEADRLNRFVADLLDLSRLHGGAIPVHPELNAVDDLIGAMLQRVAGVVGDRTIDIVFRDSSTLLVGRFDFVQALRIVANLVENAHKYSPPGTPITLTILRDGAWLRLIVADRGPGVPAAEGERIFEPFYRPAASIADGASAGLGLSIARSLATLQGGAVVHRPRPGGGTEFELTLPAVDFPADDELPTA